MKKVMLCIISVFMLFAVSVMAADVVVPADTPSVFGTALSTFLSGTVFPVLGALVLGFVSWAAKKIGNKFHIESLVADNNFLTNIAAQGVAFAEEKAANYAKNAKPLSGGDKLNSAIAYVLQMAPKVSESQAQSLVTSALAMLPGVGATGPAAVGTVAPVATVPPVADPLAVSP